MFFFILCAYSMWIVLVPTPLSARDVWANQILGSVSVLFLLYRGVSTKQDRSVFLLLASSLAVWQVTDFFYAYIYGMESTPTVDTALNVGYFIAIIFFTAGVTLLLKFHVKHTKETSISHILNAGVTITLILGYLALLFPNLLFSSLTAPIGDVMYSTGVSLLETVVFAFLISLITITSGKLSPMWWCLFIGIGVFWFSDMQYYVTPDYDYGSLLDIGWIFGFFFIALSGWVRPGRKIVFSSGKTPLFTPVVALIFGIVFLVGSIYYRVPFISMVFILIALVLSLLRLTQILKNVYFAEQLTAITSTDSLTGLKNRNWVEFYLDRVEKDAMVDAPGKYALLLVKMKTLRGVNETFGIAAGDSAICSTAKVLELLFPHAEVLARLHAGTFAVLIKYVSGDGRKILEEAKNNVTDYVTHNYPEIDGLNIFTEFVYGGSVWPADDIPLHSLVQKADVALAVAERTNVGQAWYTPKLEKEGANQFVTEQLFRAAVNGDEIVCYYQPKLSVATGEILEMEALVRWVRPEHGVVPPNLFIPAVKQAGLMNELTKRVLTVAIGQTRAWRDEGIPIRMSVNLSITDFLNPQIVDAIVGLLEENGLPGNSLMLEITETETVETNMDVVRKVMKQLSDYGVSLSLDDYGTGHSTLERLRAFPFKELKFDRSFIGGIGHDRNVQDLIKSTTNLAHEMGLLVVAEGVETEEDYTQIVHAGCDTVQGYYVSAPKSPREITRWWKNYSPQTVEVRSLKDEK